MRKHIIVVAGTILLLLAAAPSTHAFTITPPDVTVSAYVGVPIGTPSATPTPPRPPTGKFGLFGYTSPGAKVSVDNPGMYVDTTANDEGYFEFGTFFSQLQVEDICLVAQDELGRVSPPVCIPPIPSENSSSIGPIIMPPTISINNDSFYSGDAINITGQATPNTEVKLSLFTDESKTSTIISRLNPFKPVWASSLPKQDIKVDKKGNFTLTLPSQDPLFYRTFGQTVYEKSFSPKSLTLNFDIFPGWFILMKFFLGFLLGLKSRLFEIVVFIQVLIIGWLVLRKLSHPHKIARMRALALQEHPLPMITEHQLMKRGL